MSAGHVGVGVGSIDVVVVSILLAVVLGVITVWGLDVVAAGADVVEAKTPACLAGIKSPQQLCFSSYFSEQQSPSGKSVQTDCGNFN